MLSGMQQGIFWLNAQQWENHGVKSVSLTDLPLITGTIATDHNLRFYNFHVPCTLSHSEEKQSVIRNFSENLYPGR